MNAAITVASCAVLGLALLMVRDRPHIAGGATVQRAIVPDTRPVLAVVGDSYSGGSAMGGIGEAGWPAELAVANGWSLTNLSVGGTGFVNKGQSAPFADRLQQLRAADPAIVIVEGGHNDQLLPSADVDRAADAFLTQVKQSLPNARLIVVGPIWPTDSAPPSELALDTFLKSTAAGLGAQFVDPIADHWFSARYAGLIGTDGTHPTDAGHRYIARLMKADLG